MKKFSFWMLAAIMTLCSATTMLTSCTDSIDTPVVPINPSEEVTEADLKQALIGLHIDASDYVTGEEAFRVWDMKDDNTFTAYDLYYDDSLRFVVDTVKGTWKPLANQSVWWDKTNTDKLQGFTIIYDKKDMPFEIDEPDETYFGFLTDDEDENDETELFFLSDYALNELATLDAEETEENAQARTRAAQFGNTSNEAVSSIGQGLAGGVTRQNIASVATAQIFYDNTRASLDKAGLREYFNPNDKGIFTPDNWREQKTILLYDRNGSQQYTDGKGGIYNFTQVELPWSNGTVISNLPLKFCDNIMPQTGWELVMNNCGRTDFDNSNYFALYNKYTGTLRFFVFVPQGFTTTDINDHAWRVTLSEEMAHHLGMKYGMPMDTKIVNKEAIGMGGTDYNILVSPWMTNNSDDGLITPRPGWWAFDVDMSLYRPGFTPLGQKIRVQMDGWKKSQVSLNSTIKAQIKEEKYPDTFSLSSLSGLISGGKENYTALVSAVTALSTDGIGGISALFSAVGAAKDFVKGAISTIKTLPTIGQPQEPYYETKQYVDGTIDTKGLISSSTAITNMYAPTYNLNQFETAKSTLGQGVWNLTTKPVIYQFSTVIKHHGNQIYSEGTPSGALAYIFDPTSVEVKLNPNVFNPKEVESVNVSSLCIVRKDSKGSSSNDYRKAFGMYENKWLDWDYKLYNVSSGLGFIPDFHSSFYDYLVDFPDKDNSQLKFPTIYYEYDSWTDKYSSTSICNLVGRGNDEYIIEPLAFLYSKGMTWLGFYDSFMPNFEIAVVVSVKMSGIQEPFVYKRTYIPEVRTAETNDVRQVYEGMKSRLQTIKNNPQTSASAPLIEQQLYRAKRIFETLRPTFEEDAKIWFKAIDHTTGHLWEAARLFDNNLSTEWFCADNDKDKGAYIVTFQANRPINAKSYQLITYSDTKKHKGSNNPSKWELLGQKSDGSWVRLDKRDAGNLEYERLPAANGVGKTYAIRENFGTYQKFQWRVYSIMDQSNFLDRFFSKKTDGLYIAEMKAFEEEPVTFTCEKSSGGEPSDSRAQNLLDDNHFTRWFTNERVDGKWFVEFKASRPISPISYYFLSGTDSGQFWDRTPKAWKMYGKKNASDEWTVLSDLDFERDGDDAWIPGESIQKSSVFKFNKQQPQDMQYFRLEISKNFNSTAVQLNELIFNY